MILGGQLPGKVGSRWGWLPISGSLKYSSLAQSVERMTVNHDVVGSSPTGGVKTKILSKDRIFLFCIIHFSLFNIHHSLSPTGFFNE